MLWPFMATLHLWQRGDVMIRKGWIAAAGLFVSVAAQAQEIPSFAAVDAARNAWSDCLARQVVQVGAGNTENGETVLKAAKFYCANEEEAFMTLYNKSPFRAAGPYYLNTSKETAENRAAAELIKARQAQRK